MTRPPIDSQAYLDLPALAPPDGVTPNFVNPSNLSIPGLAIAQPIVATMAVLMRLYTKQVILKRVLTEDWWLLAAWICFMGLQANVVILETLPIGVHQWDMTVRSLIENLKIFHISSAIYCLVALPLKVAIILQIRRIVLCKYQSEPHRGGYTRLILRWVIDFFIATNVVFYLFIIIFQLVTCQPLRKAWDFRIPGSCVPHRLVIHIVSASINVASDLITIILPQPVIWSLNMKTRKKWGLSAVFLLGALACAASAIRLYYTVLLNSAVDLTYAMGITCKWAEPEFTLGFLAICLPVLPRFLKHILRTPMGRKVRGLWTTSPITEVGQTSMTVGSVSAGGSRVTKTVVMDIEFAQLTALESRNGSLHTPTTGDGTERSGHKHYDVHEEWHNGTAVQIPRRAHTLL